MSNLQLETNQLLIGLSANVATLMERTNGLPELRDRVARMEESLANLRVSSEKHSGELARIKTGSVQAKEQVSILRAHWKGAVVLLGFIVEHFWPKH